MRKTINKWVIVALIITLFSSNIIWANQNKNALQEILGEEVVTYKLLKEKQARLMKYCSNAFTDYKEYKWYGGTVAMMVATQKVGGYPDGTLRPEQNITQAEVLKVLLSGEDFNQEIKEGDKWYAAIVQHAIERGIVSGTMMEHNYSQQATRLDVAKYMYNYLGLEPSKEQSVFKDVDVIDGKIVQTLHDERLVAGYSEKNEKYFKPKNTITRAEAFSMLINLIGYEEDAEAYKGNKLEPEELEEELELELEKELEEEQKETISNGNSKITQKEYDFIAADNPSDIEDMRRDLKVDYGAHNIEKYMNIVNNFFRTAYNFDYRNDDFETFFNRIEPYMVGDIAIYRYKDRHANYVKHKLVIESKFVTHEDFVYVKSGSPHVKGILKYRINSIEGNFKEYWGNDYEVGKWYQILYEVDIGTGLKGEAFVNYYVNGFDTIGPGESVKE